MDEEILESVQTDEEGAQNVNKEGEDAKNSASDEKIGMAEHQRLLEEAEQRGYRRGLMEQGEKLMKRPALYEQIADNADDREEEDVMILGHVRRSVWD